MTECLTGQPIPATEAWRMLDDWKRGGIELGVYVAGKSGSVAALVSIESARAGRVVLKGEGASVTLNLKGAEFAYGPVKMFPRWPAPPMVEVMALQAILNGTDWLVMAEGLAPEALAPTSLPA
jgi:hypothetical protein